MKNKLRSRAEHYLLWFDRIRLRTKEFFKDTRLHHIRTQLEWSNRMGMMMELFRDWARLAHREHEFATRRLSPLEKNRLLPVRVPEEGELVAGVLETVNRHGEAIKQFINKAPQESGHGQEVIPVALCMAMLDCLTTGLSIDLIYSSELMVMDDDLARSVINSNNTPIKGEDLKNIPFDRCIIEFGEPVPFLGRGDKKVNALAVGFYRNVQTNTYFVTWYTDLKQWQDESTLSKTAAIGWTDMASVLFTPYQTERTVVDENIRRELGVSYRDFGLEHVGALLIRNRQGYEEYERAYAAVKEQLLVASRNMWDFVTCRNIDYERAERPQMNVHKIKRYRHIPNMEIGPRVYKVIKVNRVEDSTGGAPPDPDNVVPLEHRIHVPGCFHKWVFCQGCQRVHRHDLIGRECRRCKLQVGPFSNIVIKKFWHKDYWVGPDLAPIKPAVRELKRN